VSTLCYELSDDVTLALARRIHTPSTALHSHLNTSFSDSLQGLQLLVWLELLKDL